LRDLEPEVTVQRLGTAVEGRPVVRGGERYDALGRVDHSELSSLRRRAKAASHLGVRVHAYPALIGHPPCARQKSSAAAG
jgi:hypothetical protein